MFDQLDQFEEDRNKMKTAFKDAPAQWELLKYNLSQLTSKRHDDTPFEWIDQSDRMETFVRLGEVAAQLFDEGRRDLGRKGRYRIRFGRVPLGPNEVRLDELVDPDEWELAPGTLEDEFIWLRGEYRFFPEKLAEAIAIKLTEVYDEFKDARSL